MQQEFCSINFIKPRTHFPRLSIGPTGSYSIFLEELPLHYGVCVCACVRVCVCACVYVCGTVRGVRVRASPWQLHWEWRGPRCRRTSSRPRRAWKKFRHLHMSHGATTDTEWQAEEHSERWHVVTTVIVCQPVIVCQLGKLIPVLTALGGSLPLKKEIAASSWKWHTCAHTVSFSNWQMSENMRRFCHRDFLFLGIFCFPLHLRICPWQHLCGDSRCHWL